MVAKLRPTKFLFVIDNLSTGGAQRQMVNLAVGLHRRGHAVELFCYATGDLLAQPLYKAGIPVHWFVKNSRYSMDVVLKLSQLIRSGHFDLVLSFLTTPNFYAILASRVLAAHRVPVVVSERFCDLPDGVSRSERMIRQFYRLASHVTTNSHHQRDNLAKKHPAIVNRLSTIYNGYDLEALVPATAEPNNHPLKLLTIASVSRYKNGMCLVEALKILREKYSLTPCVDWIGQRLLLGERLDYLKVMEAKIAEYGLESQWNWLDQRSDIIDQLHQHDVLVHPSYGEGLPNVVCEALSCARPVIVSSTLDHARLVEHRQSGLLFDWHDPADLADQIKLFSDLSTEERAQMGRRGRQYAEANLSLDRFVNDYEGLFAKVLA